MSARLVGVAADFPADAAAAADVAAAGLAAVETVAAAAQLPAKQACRHLQHQLLLAHTWTVLVAAPPSLLALLLAAWHVHHLTLCQCLACVCSICP